MLQVGDLLLQTGVLKAGILKPGQSLLQGRNLPRERDDAGLLLLEMSFRVQQVIDRRHEALDPVAPAGQTGKAVQEIRRAVRPPDFQHAQHLPFREKGPQLRIAVHPGNQPLGRRHDFGPRSVAEREGECHYRKRSNAS